MPESQEREGQRRDEGQRAEVPDGAQIRGWNGAALVGRDQLGDLDVVHNTAGCIVQGELVPKSPRKNTDAQDGQSDG